MTPGALEGGRAQCVARVRVPLPTAPPHTHPPLPHTAQLPKPPWALAQGGLRHRGMEWAWAAFLGAQCAPEGGSEGWGTREAGSPLSWGGVSSSDLWAHGGT